MVDSSAQDWSPPDNDGHLARQPHSVRSVKLLTVQEVADLMKVSEKTVRRLIKRGDIAAYKLGDRGQLRVKERDLEQYVEAHRVDVGQAGQLSDETEPGT